MTIYSGTKNIGSLYFGTQSIAKAYRGDNLVFQKKEPRRLFQNIIVTPMSTSFEIAWDDHIVEAHTVELALWSEQGNLPYHARQQWVSLGGSKDTSPFIVHNIPYRSGYYRIRLRTVNNRSIVENLIVENRACIVGPCAPRNVRVMPGTTSLHLEWDANPGVAHYTVYYTVYRGAIPRVGLETPLFETTNNYCDISDLSPDTPYHISRQVPTARKQPKQQP